MKLLDTILFILSATYMLTLASSSGDQRDKRAGPITKEEAFYTMVEGLHRQINDLYKDRDINRKHFQELEDKVYHHQKTIHKLRVELHGLNEQQTTNQDKIQNLQGLIENQESNFQNIRTAQTLLGQEIKGLLEVQANFTENVSRLEQIVLKRAEEKENFSDAVYDMNKEIKTICDSIQRQKSDLEQLQFTFQHVIEAEFGKPKHKSKSKTRSKKKGEKKPTSIPILDELSSSGSGDLELDVKVTESPKTDKSNQTVVGDLDLNSNDTDSGSGDLDLDPDLEKVNPVTPTQETPATPTMFTSTDSEDKVDITNNGILHVFSNDFAERFIEQVNAIDDLKVKVKTLNITVKNLEEQFLEIPTERAQTGADLFRDMFSNLTQQMLTLQQLNTVNIPNVTNTFSNQKELDKLLTVVMETKNSINDLARDAFDEKIQNEAKLSKIDFKIFQMNKTVSTAVRRLEKYKERTRDTNDDFGDQIAETSEKNLKLEQRLAHVEVNVFNASLQKCLQKDRDNDQDKQIVNIIQDLQTLITVSEKQRRDLRRLRVLVEENNMNNDLTTKVIGDLLGLTKNLTIHIPELLDAKAEVDNFVEHLPLDCTEIYHKGIRHTGIYLIRPLQQRGSVGTYCDMDNDDGWTLIQRRLDGTTDFNRDWYDYKFGFGDTKSDFWIGNDNIYYLTIQDDYMLQVDMWDMNGVYWYALYENFYITSSEQDFILTVNNYTGNATDSMSYSNGMKFGTPDVDNDASSTHCASFYHAGWWYKHCQFSNLNGRFDIGMVWFNYEKDEWMQMKKTTMKIKPRNSSD